MVKQGNIKCLGYSARAIPPPEAQRRKPSAGLPRRNPTPTIPSGRIMPENTSITKAALSSSVERVKHFSGFANEADPQTPLACLHDSKYPALCGKPEIKPLVVWSSDTRGRPPVVAVSAPGSIRRKRLLCQNLLRGSFPIPLFPLDRFLLLRPFIPLFEPKVISSRHYHGPRRPNGNVIRCYCCCCRSCSSAAFGHSQGITIPVGDKMLRDVIMTARVKVHAVPIEERDEGRAQRSRLVRKPVVADAVERMVTGNNLD